MKGDNGKPVANASVYVRYNVPGDLLRKDKLAELDLKTNGDGSVRVPAVPQGKILIQVIAPGWHTYGKWYDIEGKEEDPSRSNSIRPITGTDRLFRSELLPKILQFASRECYVCRRISRSENIFDREKLAPEFVQTGLTLV